VEIRRNSRWAQVLIFISQQQKAAEVNPGSQTY
jgi:hypothetical protein